MELRGPHKTCPTPDYYKRYVSHHTRDIQGCNCSLPLRLATENIWTLQLIALIWGSSFIYLFFCRIAAQSRMIAVLYTCKSNRKCPISVAGIYIYIFFQMIGSDRIRNWRFSCLPSHAKRKLTVTLELTLRFLENIAAANQLQVGWKKKTLLLALGRCWCTNKRTRKGPIIPKRNTRRLKWLHNNTGSSSKLSITRRTSQVYRIL